MEKCTWQDLLNGRRTCGRPDSAPLTVAIPEEPPVPEGFQREIDAGRMRKIGWNTYMVVPFHDEGPPRYSIFDSSITARLGQAAKDFIEDLARPNEPKSSVCPCGIHRGDCEYHRDG